VLTVRDYEHDSKHCVGDNQVASSDVAEGAGKRKDRGRSMIRSFSGFIFGFTLLRLAVPGGPGGLMVSTSGSLGLGAYSA
jgi:hypothetical protein